MAGELDAMPRSTSEAETEPITGPGVFNLSELFQKGGQIRADTTQQRRKVVEMLGGEAKARDLLRNGTKDVVLYPSEFLNSMR